MVATRNMSAEEQAEMIRALEQKLEEMQRWHGEEMAAVKQECLAQMTMGKAFEIGEGAGGGQDKTVLMDNGENEEHSSAQD